ncbi:MAG: hypothetical protein NE327_16210, partial [Lentisphaeraceae bacterium]|nr:hypothetical protein [Lentisphaeraceae bacterium]
MLKYFLVFSILFTTSYAEDKMPPEVSLKMYVGTLISYHNLTSNSKYLNYFSRYVAPIFNSAAYSETCRNVRAYQSEKGKQFLTAKIIFGAYRNMLNDEDLLVLLNLATHEKEEQEFIQLLSQAYVSRMDSVIFINDSIDNSSADNTKYIKYDIFNPIVFGEDLQIKFAKGEGSSIDIRSNHRKYTDIVKHCFRQIVKNYKIDDYKVEIIWKRVEGEDSFMRSPLEIYAALANPGKSMKNTTYFGDFSHTGKIRSWGLIRENFKQFQKSASRVAYVPVEDLENLKEISLLYGKSSVIRNQFIGLQTTSELTEADGNDLKPEAIHLYDDIMSQANKGQLKGAALVSALNKVLSI